MAETANDENVGNAARPPQYRSAVKTLRTSVKHKKDRIAGINGEIADAWGRIEGMGVNKKGAKIFEGLDKLEPDERADALRSLQGLIAVSDWPELTDLVDKAQNNPTSLNLVGAGEKQDDEGDQDDDRDPDPDPDPADKPKSGMEALRASKARLRSVPKVDPVRVPDAMDPAIH